MDSHTGCEAQPSTTIPSPTRRSPRISRPAVLSRSTSTSGSQRQVVGGPTFIQMNLFGRRFASVGADVCTPNESEHTEGRQGQSQGEAVGESSSNPALPLPELAAHERVRAQKRKAPVGPRGRAKAARVSKQTKVSVHKRVTQDFPDQGLTNSAGKIFCTACREELPNIKEHIKRHISSAKHEAAVQKLMAGTKADATLHDDLAIYFEQNPDEKCVCVVHHTIGDAVLSAARAHLLTVSSF